MSSKYNNTNKLTNLDIIDFGTNNEDEITKDNIEYLYFYPLISYNNLVYTLKKEIKRVYKDTLLDYKHLKTKHNNCIIIFDFDFQNSTNIYNKNFENKLSINNEFINNNLTKSIVCYYMGNSDDENFSTFDTANLSNKYNNKIYNQLEYINTIFYNNSNNEAIFINESCKKYLYYISNYVTYNLNNIINNTTCFINNKKNIEDIIKIIYKIIDSQVIDNKEELTDKSINLLYILFSTLANIDRELVDMNSKLIFLIDYITQLIYTDSSKEDIVYLKKQLSIKFLNIFCDLFTLKFKHLKEEFNVFIFPLIQVLCEDTNFKIRKKMPTLLSKYIGNLFKNKETYDIYLEYINLYFNLLSDSIWIIRTLAIENIHLISINCNYDYKLKLQLHSLNIINDGNIYEKASLIANISKFLYDIYCIDYNSNKIYHLNKEFLFFYFECLKYFSGEIGNKDEDTLFKLAYQFPSIIFYYSNDAWQLCKLLYFKICKESLHKIRSTLSLSFGLILDMIDKIKTKQYVVNIVSENDLEELIKIFDMFWSNNNEIFFNLLFNIDKITCFFKDTVYYKRIIYKIDNEVNDLIINSCTSCVFKNYEKSILCNTNVYFNYIEIYSKQIKNKNNLSNYGLIKLNNWKKKLMIIKCLHDVLIYIKYNDIIEIILPFVLLMIEDNYFIVIKEACYLLGSVYEILVNYKCQGTDLLKKTVNDINSLFLKIWNLKNIKSNQLLFYINHNKPNNFLSKSKLYVT